ncbi:TMEM165/GDT1 family protein [Sphingomonas sp.]|uniref:TMEM165/GDT1 family protein n=1 Tax=Sphingomonas sp. TaxID=28214 RepID=UPI002EDA3F6B
MDSLVPAFVAVLLAQAGDRSPWLVAILADRFGKPFTVALAAFLAHAAGNAVAAIGGALIAPLLTPDARQLLVALALLFASMGALWRQKPPERLDGWKLGAFATSLFGVFILAAGDTTQFLTFAFAAHGPSPVLAAIGATIAVLAVNTAAALLGEKAWRKLPIRAYRIGFGLLCLTTGLILAAGALRLI